jgi:tRNA A-37 threonylcarbamoyl transferase component Bud32
MIAQLEVIAGADRGRVFPLSPGAAVVLGRGRQTMTRLNDLHVSRVHCQIEFHGGDIAVKDLYSVGGTFVNGRAVTEHILQSGDILRLGETELRFERTEIADQNTLPPSQAAAAFPVALSLDDPLPRAEPIRDVVPVSPEDLPVAIPIPDDESDIVPASAALKVLSGERLGELSGAVLSHYRVGDVLARGKSGVVFRARDLKRQRDATLKVLKPEFARNNVEVQRFIRSMKTMMPLRHPNLVALYGAGKKGPYCWVAMEYIDGESLTQVIQRIGVAGMLDWRHAFRIAVHLGRALAFAHERHVLHRNLTPQNVLIQHADRTAKLGDLMLAKAIEGNMAQQITQANEVLGDVRYMSPEQTFGPEQMDGRSDLYSLGALLYAALTGQAPFEGDNLVETITKIRQTPMVVPKRYQMSIPDAFQSVILRLLAKRPEERHQSAEELLEELERVARYQGVAL